MNDKYINIFFEGNEDLVNLLATSIASICCNTRSYLHIYVLDCGLNCNSIENLKRVVSSFEHAIISLIPIDLTRFKNLKGYTKGNYVDCYARLLIPELITEIEKAIYLDCDTVVIADIKSLWDVDLGDNDIAAVIDLGFNQDVKKHYVDELGGKETSDYINGGVFVINCINWRDKKLSKKLIDLAAINKDRLICIIEDLFTLHFENNFLRLDNRWCFMDCGDNSQYIPCADISSEYIERERRNVKIMHFSGENKVWREIINPYTRKKSVCFDEFWYYAKMTMYYESLKANLYSYELQKKHSRRYEFKLFNILPVLKLKRKENIINVYLFGFIKIGCINC